MRRANIGKLAALHPWPSMSKAALLLSPCIAWADPRAKWYDDRFTDTTKRDRGTAFHEAIDAYIKSGLVQLFNDEEMDAWLQKAIAFVNQVLLPRCETLMSEVAVAINWGTGEAVILNGVTGRAYPGEYRKDGWQCGTADIVAILKDGSLLIGDWKTGGTDGANEQLLSLAYGFQACMLEEVDNMGVPEQRKRRVKIACLKVFEGGISPDERDVSAVELGLHRDGMLFAMEGVGGGGSPVPGIHCTTLYCPHLAFCPAINGIVDTAAEGPQSLIAPEALGRKFRMTDQPSSADEAGYVMARVTAAKRQLDYYSNALKDYATKGGQVVCGQYVWSKGKDGFRWRKG